MKTWRNIVWIACTGDVFPTGGGGETSVARMAPEASSVTVSQQMRRPVAKGTFSTASSCQISWGWVRLGDHDGGPAAATRTIDSGPHEGELETSDRGDDPSCTCLRSSSRINPAPQAGWSRFEIAGYPEKYLDSRGGNERLRLTHPGAI